MRCGCYGVKAIVKWVICHSTHYKPCNVRHIGHQQRTNLVAIGNEVGALLMADMAHIAGLIVGGVANNPFDYGFHAITTTTHKTLRGPRGGLILSKGTVGNPLKKPEKTLENIPTLIDRSIFPGMQGGPHMHVIAAKAVAFYEALQPDFKEYAAQIVKNAAVLALSLIHI